MKLSNWFMRDGAERPLIWPCVTLVLLGALNLWVNPHFLSLRILDGHLFGAPIDVLNRAAPLGLVATGMTLVIATRGIDISVGAVVAIAGAAAATILATQPEPSGGLIAQALIAALIVGVLSGMWNGLL
ncbi:ABC transporter permease, partial [Desulfobacter hydrogenophilus]|nr:ABC transporter permease [Desulfobacter hydrogenophilus]